MMRTSTILDLEGGRVLVGRIIDLDAGTRLVSGREEMPKHAQSNTVSTHSKHMEP